MKKGFIIAFLVNLVILTVFYQEDIINFILIKVMRFEEEIKVNTIVSNNYKTMYKYLYIEQAESTIPNSYRDLEEIYYTVLNAGMNEYSFYCSDEYENCFNDIEKISNDSVFLNSINNFVHPYNSYEFLSTDVLNNKNTIHIKKKYTDDMINELNTKVNEIIKNNITSEMTDIEKIRTIHDYIINTTSYDKTYSGNSHLAYGALIEGKAICGGYTDAMSLFLYEFDIPNYKISNDNHIWNLVKLDGIWYHLDLTWDDPVNDFRDVLTHNYFLITDEELNKKDDSEHIFDKTVYLELNN